MMRGLRCGSYLMGNTEMKILLNENAEVGCFGTAFLRLGHFIITG